MTRSPIELSWTAKNSKYSLRHLISFSRKKRGKKEAAYLKPADVEAPLGLFQISDLQSILRQLLRIWKQPKHISDVSKESGYMV